MRDVEWELSIRRKEHRAYGGLYRLRLVDEAQEKVLLAKRSLETTVEKCWGAV